MDAACVVVSPVGKPQKIQNTEQEDVPTKERGFEGMLREEKKIQRDWGVSTWKGSRACGDLASILSPVRISHHTLILCIIHSSGPASA